MNVTQFSEGNPVIELTFKSAAWAISSKAFDKIFSTDWVTDVAFAMVSIPL
jgi:hypothetical protein